MKGLRHGWDSRHGGDDLLIILRRVDGMIGVGRIMKDDDFNDGGGFHSWCAEIDDVDDYIGAFFSTCCRNVDDDHRLFGAVSEAHVDHHLRHPE